MSTEIVPAETKVAAKRAFVRTWYQALASIIPQTGVALVLSSDWLVGVLVGAASGVTSATLAGAAAYAMVMSKGIPEAYIDAAIAEVEPGEIPD